MKALSDAGFQLAPIALCVTQQRVISLCNDAFLRLFGYDESELTGQSIALLYPTAQEFDRIGQRGYPQMEADGRYQDERLMQRKDGSMVWCRVSGQTADLAAPTRQAVWMFELLNHSDMSTQRLSPREREVVACLAQGLSSKQIALRLALSPRTIDMHRARLRQKLGVSSTAKLLALLV
ncbi:MAG TPA: PAS and helix-turn-helix domain-containing protein [Telluria sp.]